MNKKIKIVFIILVIFVIAFILINIKNYKIYKILSDEYTPKYYINELYQSKEINYRMLLDKKEKQIYDLIIQNLIDFKNNFTISLSEYDYSHSYLYLDKVSKIIDTISMDHPELIQIGFISSSIQRGTKDVVINCTYIMDEKEYVDKVEEIKVIINQIKEETSDLDEFSKVKYVYDYIGKKNVYGNPNDPIGQSAYSAFSNNISPVCAGYAKASQIIFSNIGIKSVLVFGDANYALFLGNSHAWNHVAIESKFYLYDVTYSSPGTQNNEKDFYRGFLMKDISSHTPWYKKATPRLNGRKHVNNV